MYKRMIALGCIFLFSFSILYMRIFWIVSNPTYQAAGQAPGTYTLTAGIPSVIFTTEAIIFWSMIPAHIMPS